MTAKKLKRDQIDDRRLDALVEIVAEAKRGNDDTLEEELEAIHSFLRMWQHDYGDEDEPRLSMITGMIADIVAIMLLQIKMPKRRKPTRKKQ